MEVTWESLREVSEKGHDVVAFMSQSISVSISIDYLATILNSFISTAPSSASEDCLFKIRTLNTFMLKVPHGALALIEYNELFVLWLSSRILETTEEEELRQGLQLVCIFNQHCSQYSVQTESFIDCCAISITSHFNQGIIDLSFTQSVVQFIAHIVKLFNGEFDSISDVLKIRISAVLAKLIWLNSRSNESKESSMSLYKWFVVVTNSIPSAIGPQASCVIVDCIRDFAVLPTVFFQIIISSAYVHDNLSYGFQASLRLLSYDSPFSDIVVQRTFGENVESLLFQFNSYLANVSIEDVMDAARVEAIVCIISDLHLLWTSRGKILSIELRPFTRESLDSLSSLQSTLKFSLKKKQSCLASPHFDQKDFRAGLKEIRSSSIEATFGIIISNPDWLVDTENNSYTFDLCCSVLSTPLLFARFHDILREHCSAETLSRNSFIIRMKAYLISAMKFPQKYSLSSALDIISAISDLCSQRCLQLLTDIQTSEASLLSALTSAYDHIPRLNPEDHNGVWLESLTNCLHCLIDLARLESVLLPALCVNEILKVIFADLAIYYQSISAGMCKGPKRGFTVSLGDFARKRCGSASAIEDLTALICSYVELLNSIVDYCLECELVTCSVQLQNIFSVMIKVSARNTLYQVEALLLESEKEYCAKFEKLMSSGKVLF